MAKSNVIVLPKNYQSPSRQYQPSQAGVGTLLALIVGNLLVWLIVLAAIAFAYFGLPEFAVTLD